MRAKLTIARKTGLLLFGGALANWAVLWWFSDPLVPWLFGDQWRGAIPAFQAFSWLGLAMALHYSPMNFLLANEANTQVAVAKGAGLLVTVVGLAIVALMGQACAVTVAYAYCVGLAAAGGIMIMIAFPIALSALGNGPTK